MSKRLFLLLFLCSSNLHAAAPKRLAWLLGNSAYRHLPPLRDVPAELRQMETALRGAGFDVTVDRDATLEKLLSGSAVAFLEKIKPGDICFFYFSGYTQQSQRDTDSYLLPVEFDPAVAGEDLSAGAISLIAIQQLLSEHHAGLKILAIEGSRKADRLDRYGVGLSFPDARKIQEIAYAFSAPPNQWMPGESGVFTKSLAETIAKKCLPLNDVFGEVYARVSTGSKGAQQTFFQPFVTQPFYFHECEKPPDAPVTAAVPVAPPMVFVAPPAPKEEPKPEPKKVDTGRAAATLATNHKDREDYVWIPPGVFDMGCVPGDPKCKPEEKPQHRVAITKGFWMGRNEVQTVSYQRFVDEDKKNRKMPKHGPAWDEKWRLSSYPMVEVTADQAQSYCEWAGGRLPTEAEWEYAARAGQPNQITPFADPEAGREKANFFGTKGNDKWEQAAPVRSFDRNEWGLFDMAGNVWEWCKDFFSKTYFQESPAADPQGPAGPLPTHVVRGGSWDSDPKDHLRISYREGHNFGNSVGFRCVLPDNPSTTELLKPR